MSDTKVSVLYGVPVHYCDYAEGVHYFPPMGCIIAKDAEAMNAFLEWANKVEPLGDACVRELNALFAKWKARQP